MKMVMSTAGLVTTICVIILGIVDLCLVLFSGTGSSISSFLITAGFKDPVIVFAFGFVAGHLFGYMRPSIEYKEQTSESRDSPNAHRSRSGD